MLPGVSLGAEGIPTQSMKGMQYSIDPSGSVLNSRVTGIRVMMPSTTGAGKYSYPNGYVVYVNAADATVNPLTGQQIHDLGDPFAHIAFPGG